MAWYTNTTAGLLQRNGGGGEGGGFPVRSLPSNTFILEKKRKVEPKGLPSYLTL